MNAQTRTDAAPGLLAQWREDAGCVFQRDPAARNWLEVLTIYPGVQALCLHRLANRLWRRGWRYGARTLAHLARWLTDIEIHPAATIGRRLFIDHGCGVVIGETAVIGDDCTLYHGVTLGGTSWRPGKRHPTLGDRVVVGAGAKVLGPITVGHEVRVGANSVVVRDVPRNSTVVGIPGKTVRMKKKVGQEEGPYHIDLDHHLIPDPVAGAIACLIDRLQVLENRLGVERHGLAPGEECDDCTSVQVCKDSQAA